MRAKIVALFICLIVLTTGTLKAQGAKHDSILSLLKARTEEDSSKVMLLLGLARETRDDRNEKMKIAQEALVLAERLGLKPPQARALHFIAVSYQEKGDYQQALAYYKKALAINLETGNLSSQAWNLNNIGNIYLDQGNYKESLKYHLQALKKREEVKEPGAIGVSLMNIGVLYDCLQNPDLALQNFKEALKNSAAANDLENVTSCYDNIGSIYQRRGNFDSAFAYMLKALDIRENIIKSAREISMSLNNIGTAYVEQGVDYGKALEYFQRSLKIKESLGDKRGIANSLMNIGVVYMKTGIYSKAEESVLKAIPICITIGYREGRQEGYSILAENSRLKKDYERSIFWHHCYSDLKDSLLNEASSRSVSEMQTLYDTEKKNREIAELNRETEKKDSEIRMQKILNIAAGGGIVLVLLLAFFIYRSYKQKQLSERILAEKNALIEEQNRLMQDKNKNITDSINYAQRIQSSILPPDRLVKELLPDSFVLYLPKDIVSGDFYWLEKSKELVLFSAVDCTGHGVPGAMMSVMGFNLLSQAVSERGLTKPSEILKHLDAGVNTMLRQSTETNTVKDGMDLALCALDFKKRELQFAGAYNGLWVVKARAESKSEKFIEIKADKSPIGVNVDGVVDNYTNHTLQLEKGDCIYIFSDGYADQFGGPKGKKYKYKAMKELFISIHSRSMAEQRKAVMESFYHWKGELEQVDDVLVIGVRV